MARYTNEMRERAVRMVAEVRPEHPHETAALRHVAGMLGMNVETLRLWVHRAQVDAGVRPGTTSEEAEEIKRLKRGITRRRSRCDYRCDYSPGIGMHPDAAGCPSSAPTCRLTCANV